MENEKDALALAAEAAQKGKEDRPQVLSETEARKRALDLVASKGIAMLASNGEEGIPRIKAFVKVETEGLHRIWFSTNTSSRRVRDLRGDGRASVYFCDEERYRGLLLTGSITVRSDEEARKRLWREGCEIYYPGGVDDPDYTVLEFNAREANYYEGLSNVTFPAAQVTPS